MKKIIFTVVCFIFFMFTGSVVFADNGFVISVKSVNALQNGYSADIKISNYSDNSFTGALIVALYDNENKLIGINSSEQTISSKEDKEINTEISSNGNVEYIKVFLWNSTTNMKPVCTEYNDTTHTSFLKTIKDLHFYVDYVDIGYGKTEELSNPVMRIRFRGTIDDKDNIHEISIKVLDSDNKIVFIDQASCIEGEFCSSFIKATSTGTYRLILAGENVGEREEFIFHISTLKN